MSWRYSCDAPVRHAHRRPMHGGCRRGRMFLTMGRMRELVRDKCTGLNAAVCC